MIYFDSHFWFLSCHCCCTLHPCNFAQLAVLNINQSHMFMSFCQTTTANSCIIPLGNQCVPSISISLLYQGFRGQSHSFMKLGATVSFLNLGKKYIVYHAERQLSISWCVILLSGGLFPGLLFLMYFNILSLFPGLLCIKYRFSS